MHWITGQEVYVRIWKMYWVGKRHWFWLAGYIISWQRSTGLFRCSQLPFALKKWTFRRKCCFGLQTILTRFITNGFWQNTAKKVLQEATGLFASVPKCIFGEVNAHLGRFLEWPLRSAIALKIIIFYRLQGLHLNDIQERTMNHHHLLWSTTK